MLLEKNVKNTSVVFCWACEENDVVRKCLNVEINYANLEYGLEIACLSEHIEIACMIIKLGILRLGYNNNLLLRRASEKGYTKIVRQLLAAGSQWCNECQGKNLHLVNPAAQSNASLRAASYYGEIVRLLLDRVWSVDVCRGR